MLLRAKKKVGWFGLLVGYYPQKRPSLLLSVMAVIIMTSLY
jgi:hypothetical protein